MRALSPGLISVLETRNRYIDSHAISTIFGDRAPGLLRQTQAAPLLPYFPNPRATLFPIPGVHDTFVPAQVFHRYKFSRLSPGAVNRGGLSHPLKDAAVIEIKCS